MNSSSEDPVLVNSHFEENQEHTPMEEKETLLSRATRYAKILAQFVRLLLGLMLDERVETKVKVFVGAVLAYVFAPIDFIPELFSGLFGVLDDFVLSAFALNVIVNWVDPEIVRSHWLGEKDLLSTIQKGMQNAELLVPDAILKKIEAWIGRHREKALVTVKAAPAVEKQKKKASQRTR